MVVETKYFSMKGVTLVFKQVITQSIVGNTDLSKIFDNIEDGWERYNQIRLKKLLDQTTVALAVTAWCNNL